MPLTDLRPTDTASRDARDARRVADINQLQLALALYKNDNDKGANPASIAELAPIYIGTEPNDPVTNQPYLYTTNPDKTKSHLGAILENATNKILCTDADFDSSSRPNGFSGGVSIQLNLNPICGGQPTGDDAIIPIYDVTN